MSPFHAAPTPVPTREGLRVATAGILPQSPTSAGASAQHSPGAAQRSGRKPEPGGEGRRRNIRRRLASTALLQRTPTTQTNCTVLEPEVTHKDVKERALEAVVDDLLLQVSPDAGVGLGRKTEEF